jgi:hypothetical protein
MTPSKDIIGNTIITTLLVLLFLAGIISYKSIDWTVLKRLEATPLELPPIATSSASISTQSATKN